jgi:hypothetical protein
MPVYAVGGEADCFYPVSGQTYGHTTTGSGTRYIGTASRGAMVVTTGATELELNFNANVTQAYIHMFMYQENVAGAVDDWIEIKKLNGDPAFRIGLNSDGTWDADAYIGATWVNLGTTAGSVISNSGGAFDIYISVDDTAGEFRLWKDGTEIITFVGDTDIDNASFGRIRWKGQTGGTNELNLSQVIVSSESTIGWVLSTLFPDGNGANTAWTGNYTAIDEFILDTNDYIEAIATGLIETSTVSNINAAYSTYNVKALAVAMRASNDAGSVINDLQAVVRTSSTNYFSPNLNLPKDGLDYSLQYIWDDNPNTSAAWSQAQVNGVEVGVRSV